MRKLRPELAYDHPGYFDVLRGVFLIHVAIAIDAIFRPHGALFDIIRTLGGGTLYPWAALHLLCAGLILYGVYSKDRFSLARIACGISVITFNLAAVSFIVISLFPHPEISFYSAICSIGLSLISYAAVKEPKINPAAMDIMQKINKP